MNDRQLLARGSFLSGLSVGLSMVALLAVGKMVTTSLPQETVGLFMLILLAADFLNLFSNFGLYASLPKLVGAAISHEEADNIIAANLTGQVLVSLAMGILLLVAWRLVPATSAPFSSETWTTLYPYFWLVPPLFVVGALRDTVMAALAGLNRYGLRALGIITASILQVILVATALFILDSGLVALCMAMLASYAAALLLLCLALPVGRRPSRNWRMYAMSVWFSFPLYVNSMLNFFFQRLDTVVVTAMLGVQQMAVYEIAKRFPMLLSRTLNALLVPFLPNISSLLARGRTRDAASLLNRALALTIFFGNVGVLAIILFQEFLIRLLFTTDYLPATEVLGLMLAGICLAVQAGILGHTLIALNKPFMVTVANAGMAVVSLGGSYFLLPYLGLAGAGVAWIGATVFCAGYQTFQVLRLGLRLDWQMYAKAQSFMLFSTLLLYYGNGSSFWRFVALAMYTTLCFTSRIVTMEQLARLANALLPAQRADLR